MIAGITNKNEKVVTCFLSKPNNNPVEIVAPERDRPGMIANACENPIMIESIIFNSLFPSENLVSNNNIPVNSNAIPTALRFENNEEI